MKNLAIFASGSGTNAENIYHYFKGRKDVHIALILCNNPSAGVIERAERLGIPVFVFGKHEFIETDSVLEKLIKEKIDLVVLAGFLWLIPEKIIRTFSKKIINIHPALLPKYGGKGMYGNRVHEAVIASGEKESGITIHYVDEKFDEGEIIFQQKCEVKSNDTPKELAEKIHELEHRYYPEIIDKFFIAK